MGMLRNFNIKVQPRVRFLEEEQLDEIHLATLELLERTGILVHEKEALEHFSRLGERPHQRDTGNWQKSEP